jgi:hypothetical protein
LLFPEEVERKDTERWSITVWPRPHRKRNRPNNQQPTPTENQQLTSRNFSGAAPEMAAMVVMHCSFTATDLLDFSSST